MFSGLWRDFGQLWVWGEFRLARTEAKPRRPARQEQNTKEKFCFPFNESVIFKLTKKRQRYD